MSLRDLVPAGCHTYSKGNDCFPANAPEYLIKGDGCYVFDNKGKKYIDWAMGLRSVILGHSYEKVNHAVIEAVMDGVNFCRPTLYEQELAEIMIDIIPCAEMVKFGKSGSDATSAAVKLARAYTGRTQIWVAKENPFISQHDWFIEQTPLNAGTLPTRVVVSEDFSIIQDAVLFYSYDKLLTDKQDLEIFENYLPAAIVLDPSTVDVTKEKLQYLRDLCTKHGIVFILDEVISGFRYHLGGVQKLLGVTPDLATFGKAMGNGYSISALCGRRDIMQLGDRDYGNVFLMSGTYNAETTALAAAITTISELRTSNLILESIDMVGYELIKGLKSIVESYDLQDVIKFKHFEFNGTRMGTNPSMWFLNPLIKTIFDQHMIECSILMPYIAPSLAHTRNDVEKTLMAATYSIRMVYKALKGKCLHDYLIDGWSEKPVFRRSEAL